MLNSRSTPGRFTFVERLWSSCLHWRVQDFRLGVKSSAEGASIEAPQAPRGWGLGVHGEGSGDGAVPLTQKMFGFFLPRNGAFCVHSDT